MLPRRLRSWRACSGHPTLLTRSARSRYSVSASARTISRSRLRLAGAYSTGAVCEVITMTLSHSHDVVESRVAERAPRSRRLNSTGRTLPHRHQPTVAIRFRPRDEFLAVPAPVDDEEWPHWLPASHD